MDDSYNFEILRKQVIYHIRQEKQQKHIHVGGCNYARLEITQTRAIRQAYIRCIFIETSHFYIRNIFRFVRLSKYNMTSLDFNFAEPIASYEDSHDDDMDMSPEEVGSIKKSDYVVLNGRPAKVVEATHSAPGKHGHSKVK